MPTCRTVSTPPSLYSAFTLFGETCQPVARHPLYTTPSALHPPPLRAGAFYELTSLSAAFVANEWVNSSSNQWLEPTSITLKPGATQSFSYRLLLADSVRTKDDALAAAGFAVMQAVPSFSISTDMKSAKMHVLPPQGLTIKTIKVEPAGAMTFGAPTLVGTKGFYEVATVGHAHGRARVTVTYSDGSDHVGA